MEANKYTNQPRPATSRAPGKNAKDQFIWSVRDFDSLRDVATIVPLEKTRILVHSTSPQEVADRILDCLKRLSIASIYRKPKATLLAESLDHVQFYIRLFKKVDGSEKSIVIELQRRNGCSLSFISTARIILREAKDGHTEEIVLDSVHNKTTNMQNVDTFDSCPHQEAGEDEYFDLKLAADGLVRSDLIDVKVISIESLRILTDGESTEPKIALATANKILRGDDDKYQDIRRSIFRLVSHPCQEEYFHDAIEERYYLIMHNHALAVLANMLHIFSMTGNELQFIVTSDEWLGDEGLLSVLIKELRSAETRPHDAYQAMRCINDIIGVSSDIKDKAIELGVLSAMDLSRIVGNYSHALLARETDIGISMIRNTQVVLSS